MLNTPSVSTSAGPGVRAASRLERGGVAVRIARERRARDAPASMSEAWLRRSPMTRPSLAHERGREAEVGHVAGGEEQRALAARECGERLLERLVLRPGGR